MSRPISILHLEDNSDDAELVRLHLKLKKFDAAVHWVSTKAEFEHALDRGGYDVVLSDYRMPLFDGDQALRHVREHHPYLPFIMLTGELGEDRAIETLKRGATDYVLKGNLARLVTSIERAIKEKAAEAELADVRHRLAVELADMRRLHDLSARLLGEDSLERMLSRVLDACMELLGADKGNVQLLDEAAGVLRIAAYRGFSPEFLEHFREVALGWDCVCGKALEKRRAIVVSDVFQDARFPELRALFRREGLSAVISTPLFGRDGLPFGMLSTHFRRPHAPGEREKNLLDLYVQQAERILDYLRRV